MHKLSTSANNPIPHNYGTVYRTNFTFLMNVSFPTSYKSNPKSKRIVLLQENWNEKIIREIFEVAFDQFKFLNLIVVVKDRNSTQNEYTKACAYSPFKVDGDKLFCRTLNETNVKLVITEIIHFMNNRYKNFYGYPLKVIYHF